MKINHAVLHVFDFNACVNTFSDEPLDLSDKNAKRYVKTQARRTLHNPDSKRGTFLHDSAFAPEFHRYLFGQADFMDLSTRIGEYLAGELGHMEEPVSTDLLVIDFEDDSNAKVRSDGEAGEGEGDGDKDGVGDFDGDDDGSAPFDDEGSSSPDDGSDPFDDDGSSDGGSGSSDDDGAVPFDEDPPAGGRGAAGRSAKASKVDASVAASFRGKGKRYFAIILLEIKPAFMHETGSLAGNGRRNDIVSRHAVLPSPSQKVASYAVIQTETLDIMLSDKPRTIAGEEKQLLVDGLLQCTTEASVKESLTKVSQVVEELADEYGQNSAIAISKVKHYAAEADDDFDTEELGCEVFGRNTDVQRRFSEAVGDGTLPDRVRVDPAVSERITKSHKIRTDTGIEITFPSEYCDSPDFIEFIRDPGGTISIELKNITHIENR